MCLEPQWHYSYWCFRKYFKMPSVHYEAWKLLSFLPAFSTNKVILNWADGVSFCLPVALLFRWDYGKAIPNTNWKKAALWRIRNKSRRTTRAAAATRWKAARVTWKTCRTLSMRSSCCGAPGISRWMKSCCATRDWSRNCGAPKRPWLHLRTATRPWKVSRWPWGERWRRPGRCCSAAWRRSRSWKLRPTTCQPWRDTSFSWSLNFCSSGKYTVQSHSTFSKRAFFETSPYLTVEPLRADAFYCSVWDVFFLGGKNFDSV